MQRQLMFRAWDNKAKEWLLGYQLPNLGGFSMFGEAMLFNEWSEIINSFILQQKDRAEEDLIVMQSVGLTDINGNSTYEDDIIKNEDGDLRIVKYLFNSFVMLLLNGEPPTVNNTTWYFKYTIIGNAHDNPELLTP